MDSERSEQLHLAIRAVHTFRQSHDMRFPQDNAADLDECVRIANELNEA